jgi:hypothetical protein
MESQEKRFHFKSACWEWKCRCACPPADFKTADKKFARESFERTTSGLSQIGAGSYNFLLADNRSIVFCI